MASFGSALLLIGYPNTHGGFANNKLTGYAAAKTALEMGPGHRIITILCDSGMRHLSKFWKQVGEIGNEDDMSFEELIEG